jgi:hypothetical protein
LKVTPEILFGYVGTVKSRNEGMLVCGLYVAVAYLFMDQDVPVKEECHDYVYRYYVQSVEQQKNGTVEDR